MLCLAAMFGNGIVRAWSYLFTSERAMAEYQEVREACGLLDLDQKLEQLTVNIDRLKGRVDELSSADEMEEIIKQKIINGVKQEGLEEYLHVTDDACTDCDMPDLEDSQRHPNYSIHKDDGSDQLEHEDSRTPRYFSEEDEFVKSSSTQSFSSTTAHILGSVQTRLIQSTWSIILSDLQSIGVQCVVDLFEIHPFVKDHFRSILVNYGKFDPDDDNVLQSLLENHAKLMMNVVHDLVTHIDDLDSMSERLTKLGLFHVKNGIPKHYLDIMGPIFCNATRPCLLKKKVWTGQVEDSWMEFFQVLTNMMKKSYETTEEAIPEQLWLNPTEKCIIIATWHSIFIKHKDSMGKQLFVDLVRSDPNVLMYFEAFRDVGVTNHLHNRALAKHGARIMNLVGFAVDNLDNPEKLQGHMLMLGRLHVKKGVDKQFLDLMGPTFCQAIRPMVMAEGNWSLDIDGAWGQLFRILVQMMVPAYDGGEMGGKFPTKRQISLLLNSWEQIEISLEEIGLETFVKLFENQADIKKYFPKMKKLSFADLELSRSIKDHSQRVMGVLRLFVENIYDLSDVIVQIEELGQSHFARGIKSEYLDVMGPVFCHTIRPILVRKDLWNIEVEEVYLTLFKTIVEIMKKGYPREKRKTSKLLKVK